MSAVLWDAGVAAIVDHQRRGCRARRPGGWDLKAADDGGEMWWHESSATSVIWSAQREKDGRVWLHASMAHPDRIPTWDELKILKAWLVTDDRYAYQVLPPASRYVNVHPHVLHLWAVIDGPEPLPDFVREGGQI
jgi:hypothetical protein